MKKIAIILIFLPLTVFAREAFVDSYQLERLQSLESGRLECDELKGSMARIKCKRELRKRILKESPSRGTNEYSKKVYSGLTEEEAKAKIDELQSLQQKARENVDHEDLQPGEITAGQLMTEKWWIYEHVLGLDPQRLYIRY